MADLSSAPFPDLLSSMDFETRPALENLPIRQDNIPPSSRSLPQLASPSVRYQTSSIRDDIQIKGIDGNMKTHYASYKVSNRPPIQRSDSSYLICCRKNHTNASNQSVGLYRFLTMFIKPAIVVTFTFITAILICFILPLTWSVELLKHGQNMDNISPPNSDKDTDIVTSFFSRFILNIVSFLSCLGVPSPSTDTVTNTNTPPIGSTTSATTNGTTTIHEYSNTCLYLSNDSTVVVLLSRLIPIFILIILLIMIIIYLYIYLVCTKPKLDNLTLFRRLLLLIFPSSQGMSFCLASSSSYPPSSQRRGNASNQMLSETASMIPDDILSELNRAKSQLIQYGYLHILTHNNTSKVISFNNDGTDINLPNDRIGQSRNGYSSISSSSSSSSSPSSSLPLPLSFRSITISPNDPSTATSLHHIYCIYCVDVKPISTYHCHYCSLCIPYWDSHSMILDRCISSKYSIVSKQCIVDEITYFNSIKTSSSSSSSSLSSRNKPHIDPSSDDNGIFVGDTLPRAKNKAPSWGKYISDTPSPIIPPIPFDGQALDDIQLPSHTAPAYYDDDDDTDDDDDESSTYDDDYDDNDTFVSTLYDTNDDEDILLQLTPSHHSDKARSPSSSHPTAGSLSLSRHASPVTSSNSHIIAYTSDQAKTPVKKHVRSKRYTASNNPDNISTTNNRDIIHEDDSIIPSSASSLSCCCFSSHTSLSSSSPDKGLRYYILLLLYITIYMFIYVISSIYILSILIHTMLVVYQPGSIDHSTNMISSSTSLASSSSAPNDLPIEYILLNILYQPLLSIATLLFPSLSTTQLEILSQHVLIKESSQSPIVSILLVSSLLIFFIASCTTVVAIWRSILICQGRLASTIPEDDDNNHNNRNDINKFNNNHNNNNIQSSSSIDHPYNNHFQISSGSSTSLFSRQYIMQQMALLMTSYYPILRYMPSYIVSLSISSYIVAVRIIVLLTDSVPYLSISYDKAHQSSIIQPQSVYNSLQYDYDNHLDGSCRLLSACSATKSLIHKIFSTIKHYIVLYTRIILSILVRPLCIPFTPILCCSMVYIGQDVFYTQQYQRSNMEHTSSTVESRLRRYISWCLTHICCFSRLSINTDDVIRRDRRRKQRQAKDMLASKALMTNIRSKNRIDHDNTNNGPILSSSSPHEQSSDDASSIPYTYTSSSSMLLGLPPPSTSQNGDHPLVINMKDMFTPEERKLYNMD